MWRDGVVSWDLGACEETTVAPGAPTHPRSAAGCTRAGSKAARRCPAGAANNKQSVMIETGGAALCTEEEEDFTVASAPQRRTGRRTLHCGPVI